MTAAKPGPTREQQALGDWLDNAALVRSRLADTAERIPEILPFYDAATEMIASFGICELHARSLDRAVALKVFPERRKWLKEEVTRHNKDGVASLRRARKTLKPLHESLALLDLPKEQVANRLDEAAAEMRVGVADWDMKGSDAAALVDRTDAAVAVVKSSGLAAITDYVDEALVELEKVRRRADRGAVENFPIWKLLALAAIVGWGVMYTVSCGLFGCTPVSILFWSYVSTTALLMTLLFC